MAKRWLITGCSSGFGRALAQAALLRGDLVVVTARNTDKIADFAVRFPATARVQALDVTKEGDAAAAVDVAQTAFGGLDILVNNAGIGMTGAIEECAPDEYRPVFDVNVFGLIETTRAALPALRRQGGRVVNFSSIAGLVGGGGFGIYNGTKFAVEGISEALAREVAGMGIAVIIVEPGMFRTGFAGNVNSCRLELPIYDVSANRGFNQNAQAHTPGDPARAVEVLLKAVDDQEPPLHLPLGSDAHLRARQKLAAFCQDMDIWQARGSADTAAR